jgi:aminoglycoside phosphotransferase (APT) family kinase protein
MTALPTDVLRWVQGVLGRGSRVLDAREMAPSSTTKHEVDVLEADGTSRHLVVRRYTDAERLGVDPAYDAANEARALRLLEPTVVPAPALIGADLAPSRCDVPTLLESFVQGRASWVPADLDVYLASAAEVLVAIHDVADTRPEGLPDYVAYLVSDGIEPRPPAWSARRQMWERVIEGLDDEPPAGASRFIHRDFHPGNVLSDGARVTAVVDWPTAAWGPPGIDLARMRLNLASDLDPARAERFLDAYRAAGGDPADRHPFWDLRDGAEALIDGPPEDADEAASWDRFESWIGLVLSEL